MAEVGGNTEKLMPFDLIAFSNPFLLFSAIWASVDKDIKNCVVRISLDLAAPRIRSRPQKEMVRRGETVRLRCEAEGDEPIRIAWMAKGISLNDTKDARLVIMSFFVLQ